MRTLKELRETIDRLLPEMIDPFSKECILALHERISRIEETFMNMSKKISSSEHDGLATKVQSIIKDE